MRLIVPYLDEKELEEVKKVLDSGFLTQGQKVKEFENIISQFLGTYYSFAMSSCTTALHLSLVVLGIKPGDEIIVSDFTFPATANVVIQQGAKPILIDVDEKTFTIDPKKIKNAITSNTRAIIPVHAFGLSAEMRAIMDIAKNYNLAVIEDAACALGGRYEDKLCGTIGDIGCFSFHPRKSITTGEGGMIVTNNEAYAQKISILRNHGGTRGEFYYQFVDAGFNYRMSDVLAAIGVAQMTKFSQILDRKRLLAAELSRMLGSISCIKTPVEPIGYFHTFQSYVIILDDNIERDRVIAAMRKKNIECTLGTYAMHAQPYFQREYGCVPGDLPNSYRLFRQSLTLPLYPQMKKENLEQIVYSLDSTLREVT